MGKLSKISPQTGGRRETLVFLLLNPQSAIASRSGRIRLTAKTGHLDVSGHVLVELANTGLIVRSEKHIVLTVEGRELAQQLGSSPYMDVERIQAAEKGGKQDRLNAVNRAESPLGALYARVSSNGMRFLTDQEYEAGERLRLDFTKGMMMPRVSANWNTSVSAGRRSGEVNGVLDLTDSALAARQRVESAIATLGNELGGVATDICCFLKGYEQVELERKWPKRSAKFMLKAALSILAMHYWPKPQAKARNRHWGANDFRPRINGNG